MASDEFEFPTVGRTTVTIVPLGEDAGDKEYWWSRTPDERLAHMEMLRRINYGDAATARLQRILEITEVEWS